MEFWSNGVMIQIQSKIKIRIESAREMPNPTTPIPHLPNLSPTTPFFRKESLQSSNH
jgi:hypothetical protein